MNILLKAKNEVEAQFGKKATMAANLLNMVGQGEKAFGFLTGDMDSGFDVTVGFFNDIARYVAFKKRSGWKWEESDLRSVLMQIGPFSNWTSKPGSDFFDYAEKSGGKIVAEATGWQSPKRHYAFAFVPTLDGEIGILPDKSALDQSFPLREKVEGRTSVRRRYLPLVFIGGLFLAGCLLGREPGRLKFRSHLIQDC